MSFYVEEMNNKIKSKKKTKQERSTKASPKRKDRKDRKGGMPTYRELADISNLNLGQPYQEFNYKSAVGNIKVSNFVGGMLKKSYNNYKKGKQSNLRKYKKQTGTKTSKRRSSRGGAGVADNALTIPVSDTYNYSGLGLPKEYRYGPITNIGRIPHSQMALY